MRSIMEGTDKPTAIFCANDVTALGVLRAYHEFPQTEYQPSVISIDNIEAAQDTTPSAHHHQYTQGRYGTPGGYAADQPHSGKAHGECAPGGTLQAGGKRELLSLKIGYGVS